MRLVLIAGGIALILSFILTPLFANYLRAKGLAQAIRESDDRVQYPDHQHKVGTPGMGGAVILFSMLIGYIASHVITLRAPSYAAYLAIFVTLGFGLVGFADDYLKVFKQRSMGIRKSTKLVGQGLVAISFAFLALQNPEPGWLNPSNSIMAPASQAISIVRDTYWVLPLVVFILWVLFLFTATTNAVNLTDGLDGLATGAAVMSFGAYTVISLWQYGQLCQYEPTPRCYNVADPFDLAVFAAAFTGALFGFLWHNTSPARIIMGDTGSLAIGGGLASLAIMSKTQLLLPFIAGLFVIVTLSSIIQIAVFRTTGKRFFKMAPLHHHFELLGWHEITIVVRFWLIQGVLVALGIGLFYSEWVRQ